MVNFKTLLFAGNYNVYQSNSETYNKVYYFSRAQLLRPGYNEVEQGVNKSRDAIENCLCRDGFTFDGMKEVYIVICNVH